MSNTKLISHVYILFTVQFQLLYKTYTNSMYLYCQNAKKTNGSSSPLTIYCFEGKQFSISRVKYCIKHFENDVIEI